LTGEHAHDTTVLTNVTTKNFRTVFRSQEATDDNAMSDGGSLVVPGPTMSDATEIAEYRCAFSPNTDANISSAYVLSLLRSIPRNFRADDVAVIVLLAMSLEENDVTREKLSQTARKPSWRAGIGGKVMGLSGALGRLMESSALLPRDFRLRDGNNGYSITGRVHRESAVVSRRTAISFELAELHDLGPDRARRLFEKTLRRRVPVLIADEEGGRWPQRLIAGLDLLLELPRLNASLVAVIIELCTNVPSSASKAEILRCGLRCDRLGLDDLALAISPERSALDIVERLAALVGVPDEEVDAGRDVQEVRPRPARVGKDAKPNVVSDGRTISTQGADVVLPSDPTSSPAPLTLEALGGYGRAKDWAMGVKEDLVLWRAGLIKWSDMSTKLLLSGPPGVGKTTFAMALCNSLQVPLYISSVTAWLEPGYLGKVLQRMSDAFAAAQTSAPAILFIDEIDGIGRRGDGTKNYDDYWTQVVNRALELLDGAIRSDGLIIVGATNRPEQIDKALLRSGRLEEHIAIPLPDTQALTEILQYHLGADLDTILAIHRSPAGKKPSGRKRKDSSNG
jgi:hypothetical protein